MRRDSPLARAFPYRHGAERARRRLVCFPFAGGGAGMYRSWQKALGPDVDVCAYQPPGRETRFTEPPPLGLGSLVNEATAAMAALDEHEASLPCALFGHSLGALVAFEVAARMPRPPSVLFASASRPPTEPSRHEPIHLRDDAGFVAALRELGGTPAAVLDNAELLEIVLPTLRADFRIAHEHVASVRGRLPCPIIALGGRADTDVGEQELAAWLELGAPGGRVLLLPGGHFFIQEQEPTLLAHVREHACA